MSDMEEKKILRIVSLVLLVLVFILYNRYNYNMKQKQQLQDFNNQLNTEVEVWKTKEGLSKARIVVIESKNAESFMRIKTLDKEIQNLQKEVLTYKNRLKNSGSSVTTIRDSIKIDTTILNIKVVKDSINIRDSVVYRNSYSSFFNLDNYVYGRINSYEDSLNINMKIINDYTLVIGQIKKGLFKKPILYAEITNKNPYSEISSLRTYQVKSKIKKYNFGIGPAIGITVDKTLKPKVLFTISLVTNFIRF